MVVWFAGIITLIFVIAIAIIMVWVASRNLPEKPATGIIPRLYAIRFKYFIMLMLILTSVLGVTIFFLPYHQIQKKIPVLSVSVVGRMWSWKIKPVNDEQKLLKTNQQGELIFPVNKTIEFLVTSHDVNHGFGIYNSKGQLLAQTQAMPGYVNRLLYTFHVPGKYSVLCMEYCGIAHHIMIMHFLVK